MAALCERSLLPAIPLDLNMLHASERGHVAMAEVPPGTAWSAMVQVVAKSLFVSGAAIR